MLEGNMDGAVLWHGEKEQGLSNKNLNISQFHIVLSDVCFPKKSNVHERDVYKVWVSRAIFSPPLTTLQMY
jgi:hypothetical protein